MILFWIKLSILIVLALLFLICLFLLFQFITIPHPCYHIQNMTGVFC